MNFVKYFTQYSDHAIKMQFGNNHICNNNCNFGAYIGRSKGLRYVDIIANLNLVCSVTQIYFHKAHL